MENNYSYPWMVSQTHTLYCVSNGDPNVPLSKRPRFEDNYVSNEYSDVPTEPPSKQGKCEDLYPAIISCNMSSESPPPYSFDQVFHSTPTFSASPDCPGETQYFFGPSFVVPPVQVNWLDTTVYDDSVVNSPLTPITGPSLIEYLNMPVYDDNVVNTSLNHIASPYPPEYLNMPVYGENAGNISLRSIASPPPIEYLNIQKPQDLLAPILQKACVYENNTDQQSSHVMSEVKVLDLMLNLPTLLLLITVHFDVISVPKGTHINTLSRLI